MAGGAQEPTLGSEGVTPGSVVPLAEDGELGDVERKPGGLRWGGGWEPPVCPMFFELFCVLFFMDILSRYHKLILLKCDTRCF